MFDKEFIYEKALEKYRDGSSPAEIKKDLSSFLEKMKGIISENDIDFICACEYHSWDRRED